MLVRNSAKYFTCIISFTRHCDSVREILLGCSFADEEMESQKVKSFAQSHPAS